MIHTDLPIYKKGYDLLSLAADVQLNMPRTFKQSLGKRVHDECVELLLEIGYANASRGEKHRGRHHKDFQEKSSMKERPILFRAPMVRAILAGTKTQTRRVVKPSPEWTEPGTAWKFSEDGHSGPGWYAYNEDYPEEGALFYRCPYGQPGDRLWVREKFQPLFADGIENHWETNWKTGKGYAISYQATDGIHEFIDADDNLSDACKPSIHMPRWASRITLEVVSVRVERLSDISKDDAMAEGIVLQPDGGFGLADSTHYNFSDPTDSYCSLWESINGDGSWLSNPWVWAVEFKRVKGGAA